MAFTVEDGSGKKGATSYATVAEFLAYFADRAIDVTALSTAATQGLLILATDYMDTRWGLRFKGRRYWGSLNSRSVYTLSDLPSDGETVTVGSAVVTFKTTAVTDIQAEIGTTILETIDNLAIALAAADVDADDILSSTLIPDPDSPTLVVYTIRDGIATTTTAANGAFDAATTAGRSVHQQPLEFPRYGLYDSNGIQIEGIPTKVKEACCEYAWKANSGSLAPDPTVDASGLRVTGTRNKVGPIETETTFAQNTNPQITKPYPAADRLLQEYINTGGVIRN